MGQCIRLSENQHAGDQAIRISGMVSFLIRWYPGIHSLIFWYPDDLDYKQGCEQ